MASEGGAPGTLGTVRNASLLLDLLSKGPAYQQLTDLADRSGLSLPTVHRLLRSLVVAGLVQQDPESSRYGLGAELVRLSARYLVRLPVLRALGPYLVELRNATKATVLVALLVRNSVVYVDRIDGEDVANIYRQAHRVHCAFDTAAGRVLLAHADEATWYSTLSERPERDPPFTLDDRRRWSAEPFIVMHSNALQGYTEVAVPVQADRDRVVAALAATGNQETFPEDVLTQRVAPHLIRAAQAATWAMNRG